MKSLLIVLAFLSTTVSFAQSSETEASNQSVFSKSQKFDNEGVELYGTNLEMKNYKKLGFGISSGGMTGGFGFNLEVNIKPEDAFTFGIGMGNAYNTFHIAWKHNYEAAYLSPYTKVGYSSWFNSNGSKNEASSSDILRRVLSEKQMQDNKFTTHFIAGGMGLEYNQLEGELSGVNFYGELMVLGELNTSIYLPTAGVGLTYFY